MSSKIDLSKFDDREYLPELPAEPEPSTYVSKTPTEYMKSLSTRELMSYLDSARAYRQVYDGPLHGLTSEDIKKELATREHIPNKSESKLLRRLMASNHLTEEQVRHIPKYREMLAAAAKQSEQRRD